MLQPNLFRTSAFRLTWLYMVLFGASVLVLLGFIYLSTVSVIERQTMETVEAEVRGLDEQYRQHGVAGLVNLIRQRSENARDSIYLLTDPQLQPLAGNLPAWPVPADQDGPWIGLVVGRRENSETVTFPARARIFTLAGGFHLLVGRDNFDRVRFQTIVVDALTWSLAAAAALGLLGGVILSRRMLKRVDRVSRTARQIVAGDLSQRIDKTGSDDEFDRLADSLNGMLEQIERLMTGMRLATDSLAHDLRSPLTRLRGRIELALRKSPDPVGDREALSDVLAQADAALLMFDSLLKIATAEAGIPRDDLVPVDLAAIARGAAELYEPLAEEKEIDLTCTAEGEVMVHGQPELLAQALTNLLDNAVKYTPKGGRIAVTVVMTDQGPVMSVADTGPGIAVENRERVLERFVRLEECRSTPGAGLGLSLVAAVAKLHDATLTLEDNEPGLVLSMRFPPKTSQTKDTRSIGAVTEGLHVG